MSRRHKRKKPVNRLIKDFTPKRTHRAEDLELPYDSFRIDVDDRPGTPQRYRQTRLGLEPDGQSIPRASIYAVYNVYKQKSRLCFLYDIHVYTFGQRAQDAWTEYDSVEAKDFEEACEFIHERALQVLMSALDAEYKRCYYNMEAVKAHFLETFRKDD